jgi:hypothetical protein
MRRTSWLTLAALIVLAFCAGDSQAGESRRLKGGFAWNQRDKTGDLEAVFTPTGDKKWDVAFHFTFRDEKHVYSGTAEGGLAEGELKGTVLNEQKSRTFMFKGAFADGGFQGTHAEIEDGQDHPTGTLTLRESAAEPAKM